MATDLYLEFLQAQHRNMDEFALDSDRLKIFACSHVHGTDIPNAYMIKLRCRSAAMEDGKVNVADREHVLGFAIPPDYQRKAYDSMMLLTLLHPHNLFGPNIKGHVLCIGPIAPATPFVAVIRRCFEVITCQRITMSEKDALNRDACQWARHARLPLQSGGLASPKVNPEQQFSFDLEAGGA